MLEAAPAAWVAGADAPPVDASLEPPCVQPEARRATETTEATASARKRENGDRVTGFPFSGCVDTETLSDSVRPAPHPGRGRRARGGAGRGPPRGSPRAPGQAAVAIMVSAIRSVRAASRVVTVTDTYLLLEKVVQIFPVEKNSVSLLQEAS